MMFVPPKFLTVSLFAIATDQSLHITTYKSSSSIRKYAIAIIQFQVFFVAKKWKDLTYLRLKHFLKHKKVQYNILLIRVYKLTCTWDVVQDRPFLSLFWSHKGSIEYVGWYCDTRMKEICNDYADKSKCHSKSFAILLFVVYLIYLAMSCFLVLSYRIYLAKSDDWMKISICTT